MNLIELRPANPRVTDREFIEADQVNRFWLDVQGNWSLATKDGDLLAVHPRAAPMLRSWFGDIDG